MTDHVLIYDGACSMCMRWMGRVRVWDREGRIEMLPLQDPSVASRFPMLDPDELMEAMHLIEPSGQITAGAEAAERLLRILPLGGLLGVLFHLPFARPIADRVYRRIAASRSRGGCGEHCSFEQQDVPVDAGSAPERG